MTTSASRFCTQCGAALPSDMAFCIHCGAPVPETQSSTAQDPTAVLGHQSATSRYAASDAADAAATMAFLHSDDKGAPTYAPNTSGAPYGAPTYGAQASPQGRRPDQTMTMPPQQRPQANGSYGQPVASPLYMSSPEPQKSFPKGILIGIIALVVLALIGALVWFVILPKTQGTSTATSDTTANAPAQTDATTKDKASSDTTAPNDDQRRAEEAAAAEVAAAEQQRQQEAEALAQAYKLPESNSRYYTEAELAGLSDYDLYIARNEIYARHGRQFKNDDLNQYFRNTDWYHGTVAPESFDESVLNDYERKNSELIRQIEQGRNSSYL